MYKKCIKRFLDFIISITCFIFLLPVFIVIGIIIKIIDKGDIFYKQKRTGLNGKTFYIYKFKTMKNKKITKIGRILRLTSIDELPQFINIIKGDMSLVGPRPWIPEYYEKFNDIQKGRVSVKPGIIGLAQINGRNDISVFEKIEYDLKYVNNISFLMDLKIFFNSFKTIVENTEIPDMELYIKNEIELLSKQK